MTNLDVIRLLVKFLSKKISRDSDESDEFEDYDLFEHVSMN